MPNIELSDPSPDNPREQCRVVGDVTQPTTIALTGRDRIERVNLELLLEHARQMSLRLPIGDVCTAEYLIDGALWAATSAGVHRYFGRVVSYMVKKGLLQLEPITSGRRTRLYRRIR
jgi:hypothetical protein